MALDSVLSLDKSFIYNLSIHSCRAKWQMPINQSCFMPRQTARIINLMIISAGRMILLKINGLKPLINAAIKQA